MSQKKEKNSLPTGSRKTSVPIPQEQPSAPEKAQERKKKETIHKRSIFLFWFTLAALLVIFGGRWLVAITNDYFDSFVHRGSSVTEAVNNMEGLTLTEGEQAELLPLQQQWDLFTSSRLRDEVTMTASDGTELHAYLYNEQSDTTVVVIPRFDEDGTADFLPGPWLNAQTGCNILLLDQRLHGKSGGSSFGFGYLEQQDLADWLNWAEAELGTRKFILWGEGTGANTILFAAASGLLPASVSCAVAESPYASIHELAKHGIWTWYPVPAFPFLNSIEAKVNRSDAGYQMSDLELGSALRDADCTLPVLFLQSTTDEYILPEWTQEVYNAYSGPKELISEGLDHGTVYAYGQEKIEAAINEMS